jgi:hypothetical protein
MAFKTITAGVANLGSIGSNAAPLSEFAMIRLRRFRTMDTTTVDVIRLGLIKESLWLNKSGLLRGR